MFYNLLTVFLLIFSFPIPYVGNSILLAFIFSFFNVVINQRKRLLLKQILFSKYIFYIILGSLILIIYSFFYSSIRGTYDYTRAQILLSMIIGLCTTATVYTSLNKEDSENYICKIIVYVFLIQTGIEIISFISPVFLDFIKNFQLADDAEKAEESYAGFRGLALSGRLYFEFAAAYGLAIIMQMKRIIDRERVSYILIFQYLFLIVGGFFAGRTVFVGVAFSILLLMFSIADKRIKYVFFFRLLMSVFSFVIICIIVLPNDLLLFVNERFIPWVFDLFIKYYETGSTTDSASFNTLNEMYNVTITNEEWLIGAAHYSMPGGGYYKNVDAGYLRQILYWGLLGSILNFMYSLLFFYKPLKLAFKRNKNSFICIFILVCYSLTLHYKGDLLGSARFYYVILLLYMIHYIQVVKLTKHEIY